jgi:hypothetical protein
LAKLTPEEANVIHQLQKRIKHVIYLVKENRTYDQVLGDLDRGNGDPTLVDFGQEITPNYHAIAKQFVDLDNFYNTGDVSGDGHAWSFAGRENDLSTISIPQNYSSRGPAYDTEGQNRDINVGFATQKERQNSTRSIQAIRIFCQVQPMLVRSMVPATKTSRKVISGTP